MSSSSWNKIYNPKTRRFVSLNGFIGKKILESYVSNLQNQYNQRNPKQEGGEKKAAVKGKPTLIYKDGKKELWLASRAQRCELLGPRRGPKGPHVGPKGPEFKGLCVIGPAGPGKPMPKKTVCFERESHIPLTDNAGLKITSIKRCVKKCHNLLKKHDRVVVYCSVGKNRSASIACAFLMGQMNYTFDQVADIVRKKRPKRFAINNKTKDALRQTNPLEFSKKVLLQEKKKKKTTQSQKTTQPQKTHKEKTQSEKTTHKEKTQSEKTQSKKTQLEKTQSKKTQSQKTQSQKTQSQKITHKKKQKKLTSHPPPQPTVFDPSKHNPDYFNHPQHDYTPSEKKNMDYSKLYMKNPPKYLFRALRPRDLYWLFKTGNILAPCINCNGDPKQNCCKVDIQYHISKGSKPGSLKGKYLSMSSDGKVTAFFCARTHNPKTKSGFSFNINPKMSNSSKPFRDNKYKNKKDYVYNNWGKDKGRPSRGYSGLFIKISTKGLNLIDKNDVKFKKGDPNKNFADAAKEVLIENMIPGKNIHRIFVSKLKHKTDVVGENGIMGEHKMKRYQKNKAETTVVWTDKVKDILQKEFEKYNDDRNLVKNQRWFKNAKFSPLITK